MSQMVPHGYGAPGYFQGGAGNAASTAQAAMSLQKVVQRFSESSLWSTYRYAHGAALADTDNRVFTTQMGMTGQGFTVPLTISETNATENGRIPNGAGYGVKGVATQVYYQPTTAATYPPTGADLWNVVQNGILRWFFIQVFIDICPISLSGAGGGVFGTSADTGAAYGEGNGSQVSLNNGAGQVWVYSDQPILLDAGLTFSLAQQFGGFATVVDGGPADDDLLIRNVLFGNYRTAVPSA